MITSTSGTTSSTTHEVVIYYNLNKIQCEKCHGSGYQQRNDGIFVVCPICDGLGWSEQKREVPEPTPYFPPYEPNSPWYPMPWYDQPTYNSNSVKYTVTC